MPGRIAISSDSDGHQQLIFMTAFYRHCVYVYALDGRFVRQWGKGQLQYPQAIIIKNQTLFIVDGCSTRIQLFTLEGEFIRSFGKKGKGEGEFNELVSIAVLDSMVFVTDTESDRVQTFDWDGKFIRQWGILTRSFGTDADAAPFTGPYRNTICAADGHVYVCDTVNNRIQVFNEHGQFIRGWGWKGESDEEALGAFNSPVGIHVSGGLVFVADRYNHRIQVSTLDGRFLTSMRVKGGKEGKEPLWLDQPIAVAVLDERLYVLDSNNHTIQMFEIGAAS